MGTPIFPLEVWTSQITQASIPANENALRVQVIEQAAVALQNAQPVSPTEDQIYVLGDSPLGAQWGTFSPGDIAIYKGGTWLAFTPYNGLLKVVGNILYLFSSGSWSTYSPSMADSIVAVFGGNPMQVGQQVDVLVPFNATINSVTLLADQSGSIQISIWKDTYANYPPTSGDSIVGSDPPTISGSLKSQSSTLTGWTTTVNAGDILRFTVQSVIDIKRISVILTVTRT